MQKIKKYFKLNLIYKITKNLFSYYLLLLVMLQTWRIKSTVVPSFKPTVFPTFKPTASPSFAPTVVPSFTPTTSPSFEPTVLPTFKPTGSPSFKPTVVKLLQNHQCGFCVNQQPK